MEEAGYSVEVRVLVLQREIVTYTVYTSNMCNSTILAPCTYQTPCCRIIDIHAIVEADEICPEDIGHWEEHVIGLPGRERDALNV